MVGIKGKSGRKPNDSGLKARAIALYIPSQKVGTKKVISYKEEVDLSGNETGKQIKVETKKDVWKPLEWFTLFKKIYGSRTTSLSPYNWQEKVRIMMRQEVVRYTDRNGWFCNCSGGRLKTWHFKHDPKCTKCDYEPSDIERHRTESQVRANTPVPTRAEIAKQPLKVCPVHNRPFDRTEQVMVAGVHCRVPKCPDCK